MTADIHLVFGMLVLLISGASQSAGQSTAVPPALTPTALPGHADPSASPDLRGDPRNEVPNWTHYPAGGDETSPDTTSRAKGAVHPETATNALFKTHSGSAAATSQHTTRAAVVMTPQPSTASAAAAAEGLSSTASPQTTSADRRTPPTQNPPAVSSSSPAHAVQDTSSSLYTSAARSQSESQSADRALTSDPRPAGPTHLEAPSELNVGDDDVKGPRYRSSSPLDPLVAALLSVFIATTAIVFVALFLRFRQRTNNPEFHRLHDLPMDDLMEDTPLSRYTY